MPGTAAPLLEQIRSRAAGAAAERIAAARAEADAIRSSAREAAQRARATALASHERDASAALFRLRAETAARLGRSTLAARAEALDRVFAAASAGFAALASSPGFGDLLVATLRDGVGYLPDGAVTVACATSIAESARKAVAAIDRTDVTVRVDDSIPLGVMIEAGDRSVAVDGTLARRLARERPRLSTVLARRLVESAT